MLIVNMTWDREALPGWLFHVPWNDPAQGATFTDLVFPWFVFVAGCAAPLSMRSGRGRGKTRGELLSAAGWRACRLYLIGVLLTVASFAHETPLDWSHLLSWNILQLLAAAYLVVVVVQMTPRPWRIGFVAAVLALKWATFLLPYDAVTAWVTPRPVDGAPLGPGAWAHFDAVKQLINYEFAPAPTSGSRLLGWLGMMQQYLPLAAIGVIGALVTEELERKRDWRSVGAIALIGAALVAAAFALQAGYRSEGGGLWGVATVPFSKWFFSPAYCLLAAGTGSLLLAAFFAAIDLGKIEWLTPLSVLGKNALAVYVGAELSFKLVFGHWLMMTPTGESAPIASGVQAWLEAWSGSPALAGLGWAAMWLVGWWLIAWKMDARGWYWRA
ncbi:hypothetical protein MalM25_13720 [Planctomycetes bacterium MalM25]|nr:hypothetical protein MalM25_13720 [Planctomycetes bacterium MalM25]